jgi:dihydropteroate synthase
MSCDTWSFPQAAPLPKHKTLVMGVVNMTPDSFSGRNNASTPEKAALLALDMLQDGADIVDIGAESSRPMAIPLSAAEEKTRLGDVVARIRDRTDKPISVDTYHPETARMVMHQGADIINDITALRGGWDKPPRHNAAMAGVAAETEARVVLMHMPEAPASGLLDAGYADVTAEVRTFLVERAEAAERAGIPRDRIWLDPGFGFSKNFADSQALFRALGSIVDLGYGVLCGFSRKRMVGTALEKAGLSGEERLEGSLALAMMAANMGVRILRVHDVRETARALAVMAVFR